MSIEMKYFILKPKSKFLTDPYAKASRNAMRAYANTIEHKDKKLAESLKQWADEEASKDLDVD